MDDTKRFRVYVGELGDHARDEAPEQEDWFVGDYDTFEEAQAKCVSDVGPCIGWAEVHEVGTGRKWIHEAGGTLDGVEQPPNMRLVEA